MPVIRKSRQQIESMRAAGRIVAETYEMLRPFVVPGVTTAELDRRAEEYIRSRGALPMYKGYGSITGKNGQIVRPPFPGTICVALNDVVCHGIPSSRETLREGDIIGIDIGALYKGWIGDSCRSFAVGAVDAEAQHLLDVAERCMWLGIEQARPGNRLGDIGAAIQQYAEAQGCSTVRELAGHGVGRALWEEPSVAHYGSPHTGLKIETGMVFTIEPMINAGSPRVRTLPDKWTISTADGSRSAQFEHTLAITDDAPELLTVL